VLSGNRNFEARILQSVRANFLMSPPLVVAFALAGRVTLDLEREPIAKDAQGREVYLRDLWPGSKDVAALLGAARRADSYRENYADVSTQSEGWNAIPANDTPAEVEIYENGGILPRVFRKFLQGS